MLYSRRRCTCGAKTVHPPRGENRAKGRMKWQTCQSTDKLSLSVIHSSSLSSSRQWYIHHIYNIQYDLLDADLYCLPSGGAVSTNIIYVGEWFCKQYSIYPSARLCGDFQVACNLCIKNKPLFLCFFVFKNKNSVPPCLCV